MRCRAHWHTTPQYGVSPRRNATIRETAFLAEEGYDPDFGARPVKRAIQQFVLNDLSKKLLADEVDRTKPIIIDDFGDGLVFRN